LKVFKKNKKVERLKNTIIMKKYIALSLTLAPSLVMAATFESIVEDVQSIVEMLVPLIIGIAVVVFLIGVVRYVTAGGDEEKRKESRNMMIYGIIGLFVMVAVWGLVAVIANTFGITEKSVNIPELPFE
jgi:uncharacterized membrane protein YidH (DUF202 family)